MGERRDGGLLTRSEAAQYLRKKESWLRYSERCRILPFIKVGQQIRYLQTDLDDWINTHRVAPRAGEPAVPNRRHARRTARVNRRGEL